MEIWLPTASSSIRATVAFQWLSPATEEGEHLLMKIKGAIGQVAAIANCVSKGVVSKPQRQLMVAEAFL
ncbi:hypothetical protein Q3G72_012400 [Acer saccharum]|nr:hypothetical protein Q3G72_012400 [Acer saccharum]